ncbi:GNAT family N-acetyltransferase, partial [Candidatus Sumerlaeota bacterium]|nr:GNAT family N-acetyltransferase [Candidatus Sumerlaeota bacterium]
MEKKEILKTFPKIVKLNDGEDIILRLMTPADESDLLQFYHGMPENDRLFLKEDVTDPQVIHRWAKHLDYNRVIPVIAVKDYKIIADSTLLMQTHGWSRHVGEIRLAVSQDYRRKGLGFNMIKELFSLAMALKLEKVMGEIMGSQTYIIMMLKSLGFKQEAVLQDHVKDLHGDKHDLV